MTYAAYKNEDTGERFIFEIEPGTRPIHIVDEDGRIYERIGLPFEASSDKEALEDPHAFA